MTKPHTTQHDTDIDALRRRLLVATLPHVPFDGWSEAAMRAGAADAGLDMAVAMNAFPGGPLEILELFSIEADRAMLERLERCDLARMRVRDRVAAGVRARLEYLTPYREAVRRGLALLSLPHNTPLAARLLYRTVDAIWYAAGDTSTDYNYYTKRLLLAGVYSATVLFWLNDHSEEQAQTWAFLDRRIDEALSFGGTMGRAAKKVLDLPDRLFVRTPRPGRVHR